VIHVGEARTSIVAARKWSQDVTEHSNALDVDQGVFSQDDPKQIALSLKHSADRRKALKQAKDELREAFGKNTHA